MAPRATESQHTCSSLQAFDRKKYRSPPPPPSSITPPPSSQIPQQTTSASRSASSSPIRVATQTSHQDLPVNRTPTPTHSHLSSPPPTMKAVPQVSIPDAGAASFTPDQIADASLTELRTMVQELTARGREAKTSAAHHKLQYQLLRMESDEAMNRMAVELDITQREIEFLQSEHSKFVRNQRSPAQDQVTAAAAGDVTMPCKHPEHLALEAECETLRHRLERAKSMIVELGNEVVGKMEENDRLRKRIKENRNHFNLMRRATEAGEPSPLSAFQSPVAPRVQSIDANGNPRTPKSRREGLDALLLADQVLSQEAATSPSTPTGRGPRKQFGSHTRGSHSLSSLPVTPHRTHPMPDLKAYPVSAINPRLDSSLMHDSTASHHRRFSRDSTISASDMEDDDNISEDDVPESQASQEAANMLRRSVTRKSDTTRAQVSAAKSTSLLQSKLYGQVKKPGVATQDVSRKRKATDVYENSAKKGRTSEGVGLGIGGWVSHGK